MLAEEGEVAPLVRSGKLREGNLPPRVKARVVAASDSVRGQIPGELSPIEGCAKEEAQCGGRTVELRRLRTAFAHIYLETAYVFRRCGIGRPVLREHHLRAALSRGSGFVHCRVAEVGWAKML
jgi:hypothetical protein